MTNSDDATREDDVQTSETAAGDTAVAEAENYSMSLDVNIEDIGPCKKHVRVTIPQADIEHYHNDAVDDLTDKAEVPGFRIGHVPRALLQKRFKKELADQLKQKLLMESLEELAENHQLDPINEPDIDVETLDIPEEGDFVYEFDVEVRPDFEVPDYEGLTIKRPTRETTDEDVDAYLERFLSQYAELVPREEAAEKGDYVSFSIKFEHDGEAVHKLDDVMIQLKPTLRFQDAELEGFDDLIAGAATGDVREATVTVSTESENLEMRGENISATFTIGEIKQLQPPELSKEFLERVGVETEEDLREEIQNTLERQVTFQQRQAAREQVLEKITESADWDLPEQLVLRQVDNALRREILEMQQAGFTSQEIQARENEIRQRAVSTTRQALKEHFVLDRIATKEEITVDPQDIEIEIMYMAMQRGENPRRVRARMIKSGMIDNLEAQIRERKAIDFILDKATFEETEMEPLTENEVEAVPYSVCGMVDAAVEAEEDDGEE